MNPAYAFILVRGTNEYIFILWTVDLLMFLEMFNRILAQVRVLSKENIE